MFNFKKKRNLSKTNYTVPGSGIIHDLGVQFARKHGLQLFVDTSLHLKAPLISFKLFKYDFLLYYSNLTELNSHWGFTGSIATDFKLLTGPLTLIISNTGKRNETTTEANTRESQ